MPKIKKKIQMHIAQRKELDVHKTKQKRDRNRTTTSLVLDSRMQRGRWEFPLNQRIWLRLSSVFESRRISFFKIFLVYFDQVKYRVPTSTGKPGKPVKSQKKVPCMEKSWNLKKNEKSWKNHGIFVK